jgi:glycine cleavage system H lipoate-binding protein
MRDKLTPKNWQTAKSKKIKGFQVLENECIWMKAGVINYRICDHAYDCNNCPFDKGMRKAMGLDPTEDSGKVAPRWVEVLKEKYRGAQLPCRHTLTGRVDSPKICIYNYECQHCPFDQLLDEIDLVKEPEAPACRQVAGYTVAGGYYYHAGHSWVRFEHGGRVRIGLDDFANRLFGTADAIDLPPLGERLSQHEVGWTFTRQDKPAAVLAPVTGTVLAINEAVVEHPEVVPLDPYRNGWFMILEPAATKRSLKSLYYGRESDLWLENEARDLMRMLGAEYENLAATGARAVSDIYGACTGLDWELLTLRFLKTERIDMP